MPNFVKSAVRQKADSKETKHRSPLRPRTCQWVDAPNVRSTLIPVFEVTTNRQAAMRRLPSVELRRAPSATGRLCEIANVRFAAANSLRAMTG